MLLSNCEVYNGKKLRFTKQQEASGLLLAPNSPFSRIPIISGILLKCKINEVVKRFLLARDIFMPEMHLRQPGFNKKACELFTRSKD